MTLPYTAAPRNSNVFARLQLSMVANAAHLSRVVDLSSLLPLKDRWTPVHVAASKGFTSIIELLWQAPEGLGSVNILLKDQVGGPPKTLRPILP